MFLIQEMLIVMAVKDTFFCALYSASPQAQRIALAVERTKGYSFFHCQTETKICSSFKTAQKKFV